MPLPLDMDGIGSDLKLDCEMRRDNRKFPVIK